MNMLQVIAQLYIIIGAGFLLQKKFNLDNKIITSFTTYIGLPALTFYGVYIGNYSWQTLAIPILYILFHIILIAIVYLFTKVGKYNYQDSGLMVFLSTIGNNGNFGIPVVLFLLGEQALAMVSLLVLINSIFLFGPGAYFIAREKGYLKKSIIKVLKLPLLYAVILGFVFNLNNWVMPNVILTPITDLGKATVPLQLIVLGTFLVGIKLNKIDWRLITPALIFKLILAPALAYLLILIFKLPLDQNAYIMLIEATTPFAVFGVILADLYNKRVHQMAVANLLSLMFVIITLPIFWFIINL